jgi:hypothetical protein
MRLAIAYAPKTTRLPVSIVARRADGASPRAASTTIFIVMTPFPLQKATNSDLFDRFPPTRRVLVSRHKRPRPICRIAPRGDETRFPHSG